MEKRIMKYIETVEGEKLLGFILTNEEKERMGLTDYFKNVGFTYKEDDGIWLGRRIKVSYIAHESIIIMRDATIFDKEELPMVDF